MKKRLLGYLPDGLAARFTWLLVITLLVANLAVFGILSLQQTQQDQAAHEGQEVERIVALVPALEAVAPDVQPRITRNASTRMARISVTSLPLVANQAADRRSISLSKKLIEALDGREVRVAIREIGAERLSNSHHPQPAKDFKIITLSIALNTKATAWLNVVTSGERYRSASADKGLFLLILGVSLIAVLGVGLLFVRRLTQPLNALAKAAGAAGRGDHSVRLVETGAKEVRDAAQAFNTMQAQITSFDAERTRTLAAVGHDLRTPITSLRIRAEMLNDDAREPMIRTLEEMAVMAEGLVAFARGEGAFEKKEPVDLGELLAWLCEDRGATLDIALNIVDPFILLGRQVELTRAFGNLIDNALRYGKVARINLSCNADLFCNATAAVISIEDEGPGIPETLLENVFEPFVRGDNSRSSETGGIGLGLSIAKKVIRAHGGSIELNNVTNGGLKVMVRLPLL